MTVDILQLAREALEDDQRMASVGGAPWRTEPTYFGNPDLGRQLIMWGPRDNDFMQAPTDDIAAWIAAARSREPQLAKACIELSEQLDTLRDQLRVSNEQNEALGDANVLAVELEALTAARDEACSMLDDAVQLRDDAEDWFPRIAELRKVGQGEGRGSCDLSPPRQAFRPSPDPDRARPAAEEHHRRDGYLCRLRRLALAWAEQRQHPAGRDAAGTMPR